MASLALPSSSRSDLFANLTATVTIALPTSADLDIPIFRVPVRALRRSAGCTHARS